MQKQKTDKLAFRIVMLVSVLVFLLVVLLNERLITPPSQFPSFIYKLPLLNASINACCSLLLMLSYRAIRKGNIQLHKKLNLTAFGFSSLFLVSYINYHFFVGHTSYGGEGIIAMVYKVILLTHIVLAALVLPLILMSFWYGLKDQRLKHRKLVKWSFPIWLYVTISGVLVYLMISPYYSF
ncbi:MAG: DUF420 domain-containing protein [Bacteroidia bacterium]